MASVICLELLIVIPKTFRYQEPQNRLAEQAGKYSQNACWWLVPANKAGYV